MSSLAGWTSKLLADGLALYPPGGKQLGAIRMRERVRPLASVANIIAPDLARMEGVFENVVVTPIERFFTRHGEYAALVVICANAAGRPEHLIENTIAIVFGDDFYQRFDSISQEPSQFGEMRTFTRQFAFRASLGLGELRWRRFDYMPPAGWQPLARVLTTEWFPLDYPARNCRIAVPPAYAGQDPATLTRVLLNRAEPGFVPDAEIAPQPVSTRVGLSGFWFHHPGSTPDGKRLVYDHVLLHETRYSYLVFLETDEALYPAAHEIFRELVESISPFRTSGGAAADAMVHWVE